ncbi:5550_t:CDS:2, partial [Dentiscutata erythropus]
MFTISSVICGLSNDIWLLLSMRSLEACGASVSQSLERQPADTSLNISDGIGYFETFKSSSDMIRKSLNPFSPLHLLCYPEVTLTLIYFGVATTIVYTQDVLIAKIFIRVYNLSTFKVGFVFFSQGLGYIIGSFIGGHYSDFVLKKETKKNN